MKDATPLPRNEFPALDAGLCFLDWGATGLLPERTVAALARFGRELADCRSAEAGTVHAVHGETRNEARRLVARLLNTAAKDVALVESTTFGLNAAASAIRLQEGSNVVLSAIDYLAVATPWKQRARRDKLELRFVPPRGAGISVDDVLERIDAKTRVIALSTIAWTTGALLDLETIADLARSRGILLVVDAIQTFGVVPLDLTKVPASFVACGGHKWLCSPLGAGFLWVHPETAARHQPPYTGFLSGRAPRGAWFEWFADPASRPDEEVLFAATARGFETGGTPSYPGALGLVETLRMLDGAGIASVLEHVRELGSRLIDGLTRRGFSVVTPLEPTSRAGIVVFNAPGGIDAERNLVTSLRERRVAVSLRYSGGIGGVRVSLHGMNDQREVERLLAALD